MLSQTKTESDRRVGSASLLQASVNSAEGRAYLLELCSGMRAADVWCLSSSCLSFSSLPLRSGAKTTAQSQGRPKEDAAPIYENSRSGVCANDTHRPGLTNRQQRRPNITTRFPLLPLTHNPTVKSTVSCTTAASSCTTRATSALSLNSNNNQY